MSKILAPIQSEVKKVMNKLATTLDSIFNPTGKQEWGFVLLTFKFGESGRMNYISNADRKDMINAMEEWIAKYKEATTQQTEDELPLFSAADTTQNTEH